MIVSTIEIGAGSSGLSTRPILPTTRSTSGMALIAMSWSCSASIDSPIEACGIVVGIQRNEPSSSLGMNSWPRPGKACVIVTQGFESRTASGSPPAFADRPRDEAEDAVEPEPGRAAEQDDRRRRPSGRAACGRGTTAAAADR